VAPWHAGVLAGVFVAVAVGGYLWLAGGDSTRPTADAAPTEAVERGTACAHLSEAFTHSQAGDAEALRRSVAAAARAGEKALDTSGQEFGRPEEIALELQLLRESQPPNAAQEVTPFLQQARAACEALGRWSAKN